MIDIKKRRNVDLIVIEWLDIVKKFFDAPRRSYIVFHNNKRKYFTSYAEKLRYQCLGLIFVNCNNRRLKRARVAKLKCWWANIDDIILASPDTIEECVKVWQKRRIGITRLLDLISPVLVSYYEALSNEYGKWLVERLNIKTCPYCNRQFIITFKGRAYERPELDHYYPKMDFPLFCLSFFNLVPACHSCNHVKMKKIIGVNPYKRSFRRPFTITDAKGNQLSKAEIYKLQEEEINLDFDGNDAEEDLNVSVLGLKDVYNKHTDYVKELIDKSMAYDNYACQALVNSFQGAGHYPEQVYNFVWGRHLMDAEYEDRPLSKLTKDILDLLDIKM